MASSSVRQAMYRCMYVSLKEISFSEYMDHGFLSVLEEIRKMIIL
jgi:hypothetical protein